MLDDPNIDMLLVQEELPLKEGQNAKAGNLREVDRMVVEGARKPVAVVSMASYMYSDFTRAFREDFPHLPVLHEVDKALKAAAHVGRYGAMAKSAPAPRAPHKLSDAATALLAQAAPASDGRRVMGEAASKQLLGAYGVGSPGEAFAGSAEAAAQAADAIGYPVVLKLVSDDVQHKSDVRGVLIGLRNGQEVREGFAGIAASLATAKPSAHFGGVLVVRQVSGGTELVLGVHRDPEVGLVTMFGTGGVLLELVKDVTFGPVPLSEAQAAEMIERTMAGRLLEGYRGGAKLDRAAVVGALVGLSHLAQDLGERLESIDVNPLTALPSGALALDGLVVLKG